jgi:hypothetical protein
MLGSAAWRPHRSLVLGGIALSVLLAALATLQYRWFVQIGEADAARLRAGARSRAEQLGREFDREVTLAFLWLQADAATVRGGEATAYAARFSRWSRLAVQPGVVRAVYVVDGDRLRRFEPRWAAFVATAWPPDLQTVRERLARRAAPGAGASAAARRPWLGRIDPDLRQSLRPRRSSGVGLQSRGPGLPFRLAWYTVIRLDDACLRERLLRRSRRATSRPTASGTTASA